LLVLSRKLNEKILIGDDIVITVVDVRYDKVRLGITCDPSIPVDRLEVRESKERWPDGRPTRTP
jgi:carbon storage regulator